MTAGGIELKESWFKKNILRIDEQKKMDDLGIVPSHAYGLIDAVEVIDQHNKKIQLVKLRNPWGSFEWKGTWGRKCLNWTENLKYKLQYNTEDDDDGTFWMSFKDMANYFNYVTIAHISPED